MGIGTEVYYELAELYDHLFIGLPGELEFYVAAAQDAGSPVLELGCGTGRITLPIAESGVEVVGLDLVPQMLSVARRKAAELDEPARERVQLVEGDMCEFDLGTTFQLVAIPFRAFLHLVTVEDQRRCLDCVRRHLAPDGRLVFNIFDPRTDIIAAHATPLGGAMKKMADVAPPGAERRYVLWDSREYNQTEQLILQEHVLDEIDEDGLVVTRTYGSMMLRYLYRFEAQHLLESCGFEIEALFGDFDRSEFEAGGEQVWVARLA
jgi:SAM-dependent methyltransferase